MLSSGPHAHDKISNQEPIHLSSKTLTLYTEEQSHQAKDSFLHPGHLIFLLCEKNENSIHLVALFLELASREAVCISQVLLREQNR